MGEVFSALRKTFCAENGLVGSSRRCDRGAGQAAAIPQIEENTARNFTVAARRFDCMVTGQDGDRRELGTGYFAEVAQVISGGTSSTVALKESTKTEQL